MKKGWLYRRSGLKIGTTIDLVSNMIALTKSQVTQVLITRTKTRTIKMHALNWLNKRFRYRCNVTRPLVTTELYEQALDVNLAA